MENFVKPFVGNGVVHSLENVLASAEDGTKINFIRFLQKVIFKHDVVVEFQHILNLACSSEPFTVKNELIKRLVQQLNVVLMSDDNTSEKIDVFCHVFQSFASVCEDTYVHTVQFFVLLCHLLGMNSVLINNKCGDTENSVKIMSAEHFNTAFNVECSTPTSVNFSIFKELLLCLSKFPVNFNSTELKVYTKWLHELIKNLTYFVPFQNVFLEIFSVCADIDLKLLEGSLDHIFICILAQKPPVGDEFCQLYSLFLENALTVCSKFQRIVKFITKILSNIKTVSTHLTREIILPLNVISEFSKIVAVASNQQSLSLFDVLLQNLSESVVMLENSSNLNAMLLFITSDLLISFLKEVKLFAPSISSKTLQPFMDKLNAFIEILHQFGTFLFRDKSFIMKNGDIVKTFLELCFYCSEIEVLLNCYKDFILEPSEALNTHRATEYDWHCCIYLKQWKSLVNSVLKSKQEDLSLICFQLALQKCRHCKLQNTSDVDDSTLKVIMYQLKASINEFNIFKRLSPEDLTILTEILSVKHCKSVCKKIFRQLFEEESETESAAWLCHPQLQENSLFVTILFSLIMKEVALVLREAIPEKAYSHVSWLSDDYFDDLYNILGDKVDSMVDNLNGLFENGEKVRKYLKKSSERQKLWRCVEVSKLLPLPWMRGDRCRLGLSFAVVMAVLLSDDESSIHSPLQWLCSFLSSDVDASTCFHVGSCVKWLSELSYEDQKANDVRVKAMEVLVRGSPNMKFGLKQVGEMIDETKTKSGESLMKALENKVILYNELGKCWQRAKKRKADNDLIGSYRTKLAKVISSKAKKLTDNDINSENGKTLLKILAIELNKAIKTNDENEISLLMEQKFPSHFEFAVNRLKEDFDDAAAMFLMVVLQSMTHIRPFLPEKAFVRSWKALRLYEKVNWKLFCTHSTEEEFEKVLKGLLKTSKKFLQSGSEKHFFNCFEIWISFFEVSSESKRSNCQLRLQEFFNHIHTCGLFLESLPIRKKIFLVKFFSFCVSKKEVILTSLMLDTIIFAMLECLNDEASSLDDFAALFAAEAETSSFILLRQFDWSRSKVHLTFVLFKKMLATLMKRCETGNQTLSENIFTLSTCAFCLEKWAGLLIKKERDFARTMPYFIAALVSSVASITVIPAVKIHLVNCINHFLSISDFHTVSYLLRILKPGYQQVFSSMYNQFKKYHKYSGKI